MVNYSYTYINEMQLLHEFINIIPREQEQQLDMMFATTMKKIVHGEAWRRSCMRHTRYSNFGNWFQQQRRYNHILYEEKLKIMEKISQIKMIVEHWDTIVRNLTLSGMIYVEARKFSIYQMYRSKSLKWVIDYNRSHGPTMPRPPAPRAVFSMEKISEIINAIRTSGIVSDVERDSQQIELIGKALVKGMREI